MREERCPWCGDDPIYVAYHDTVWGVPEYDSLALFEKLCLDGQQAGLSWITILKKQASYRNAYDQFDPERIARYDQQKIESLLNDPGIIRNRLTVASIIRKKLPAINRKRRILQRFPVVLCWRRARAEPVDSL